MTAPAATFTPPPPALKPDLIYCDYDRFLCGHIHCAGMTAYYTGVTIGGFRLTPVTVEDIDEWPLDLAPIACECGRLEVAPEQPKRGIATTRETGRA